MVDQAEQLSSSALVTGDRGSQSRLSGLFGPVVTTFRDDEGLDLDAYGVNLSAHNDFPCGLPLLSLHAKRLATLRSVLATAALVDPVGPA